MISEGANFLRGILRGPLPDFYPLTWPVFWLSKGCNAYLDKAVYTEISSLALCNQHHLAMVRTLKLRCTPGGVQHMVDWCHHSSLRKRNLQMKPCKYCPYVAKHQQSLRAWLICRPFSLGCLMQVTPLHHDPHHNLLAQVVGTKYVRLYAPALSDDLYPYETGHNTNSSQVWPVYKQPAFLLSIAGRFLQGRKTVEAEIARDPITTPSQIALACAAKRSEDNWRLLYHFVRHQTPQVASHVQKYEFG